MSLGGVRSEKMQMEEILGCGFALFVQGIFSAVAELGVGARRCLRRQRRDAPRHVWQGTCLAAVPSLSAAFGAADSCVAPTLLLLLLGLFGSCGSDQGGQVPSDVCSDWDFQALLVRKTTSWANAQRWTTHSK